MIAICRPWRLAAGALLLALPACKKSAPPPPQESGAPAATPAAPEFSVQSIDLGKHIGADKRVSAPTTTFSPKDTIYLSVASEGSAPRKTIAARWTFGTGKLVKADSQTIAPTGPAVTEFHLAKPSGWPAGKYKVEVSVDGNPSGSKDFEVKK